MEQTCDVALERDSTKTERKRLPWHARVLRALFVIYLSTNMLVCAVLFAPWALPRETISGFMGRMSGTCKPGVCRRLARLGECLANLIYFWEENHCAIVYLQECDARRALYGDKHD